jgi:hypothetical protein
MVMHHILPAGTATVPAAPAPPLPQAGLAQCCPAGTNKQSLYAPIMLEWQCGCCQPGMRLS